MNRTAAFDLLPTHPLAGIEGWPKTGPVYGLADDDKAPRAAGFWEKLGERFRKSPSGDVQLSQARVWY
ncbi:MAG: hypothetical protein EOP61_41430 [Sphingomonadales bacterium]|nr:MAG: hypothetical protein EOP61_41430 [Sphingomonadales bacterium]